ncbi:hypothetical protein P153DRAFT_361753 [Dothidotthia symphoricarpi CBS 119687]|uniref:Uncharacterized protein n=1 Tax=Dothidotthia symphoricarpi CBS 119687 TaxID=1392245 RepID=A0A6A5ZXZ8_9PLEO|nr:uncharacterized protein P153DRAFT_361753 [Dothidotthia symphoricarpi CBS 119687]KAF2123774.1 hypothetical protein P153DRAFT_361753 [Dothidotthia symphoricarpi CBS 119687]
MPQRNIGITTILQKLGAMPEYIAGCFATSSIADIHNSLQHILNEIEMNKPATPEGCYLGNRSPTRISRGTEEVQHENVTGAYNTLDEKHKTFNADNNTLKLHHANQIAKHNALKSEHKKVTDAHNMLDMKHKALDAEHNTSISDYDTSILNKTP